MRCCLNLCKRRRRNVKIYQKWLLLCFLWWLSKLLGDVKMYIDMVVNASSKLLGDVKMYIDTVVNASSKLLGDVKMYIDTVANTSSKLLGDVKCI